MMGRAPLKSSVSLLWREPEINAINGKARSIPALNPINKYGRVFTMSWLGFLLAFWSWYAFPPLLTITIKKDLNLTQNDVANSNIVSLVATLLVRLLAGTACDRFGPRLTFVGCLLAGALPTALAGAVSSAPGLLALRFFVGILGGAFIPCQVWTTAFFDKNIIGTGNAFTAGLGNAGGGITYFAMPAIFDSLMSRQHDSAHVAWRVAFIVPFILITASALLILFACPDLPTGKWSERGHAVKGNLVKTHMHAAERTKGGVIEPRAEPLGRTRDEKPAQGAAPAVPMPEHTDGEKQTDEPTTEDLVAAEVIEKPTVRGAMRVIGSPHTLAMGVVYLCSFGAELSINSILGAYYLTNFPRLGQTGTGNWAAMFGLLNAVSRPAGGVLSDALYRSTHTLWSKKMLIHILALITGAFQLAIGLTNSHAQSTMFGLVAGMALFLEALNGATFSLVPHVKPNSNGDLPDIMAFPTR